MLESIAALNDDELRHCPKTQYNIIIINIMKRVSSNKK